MKKKVLVLFLSLALMMTVFSGCDWRKVFNIGTTSQTSVTTSQTVNTIYNDINFNVVNIQKIADINQAKAEYDISQYTDIKKVIKRIQPSVVEVYATLTTGTSAGSGVVIGTSKSSTQTPNSSNSVENSNASNSVNGNSSSNSTNANSSFSDMQNSSETSVITSSGEASASLVEMADNSFASSNLDSQSSTSDTIKSYIVTCHHVIDGATSVSIKTNDGKVYPATFIGSDPESDTCVMSVNTELSPVEFYPDTDLLEVGESVLAIGNPLGTLGGTVTSGILSATSREIEVEGTKMVLLQTDASINSGNSGGGLFTSTGFFIGMVNAKYQSSYSSVEGLGFAIPSNQILNTTKQLVNTSSNTAPGYIPGKYNLGCTVNDVYANRWGSQSYVVITSLDESGSFSKSNLQINDRILSVTYKGSTYTVSKAADLVNYFSKINFEIGDVLTMSIIRNETSVTATVTILQYIYEP